MGREALTTETLLVKYREQHYEATMGGNAGAFAVPLGGGIQRRIVPTPPYDEVVDARRRFALAKKRKKKT